MEKIKIAAVLAAGALAACGGAKHIGYIGAGRGAKADALKIVEVDAETGEIAARGVLPLASAAYIAVNRARTRLYTAFSDPAGAKGKNGGVAVYALDPAGGAPTRLDAISTGHPAPCHISLSPDERKIVFAEYGRGTAGWVDLKADGTFAKETLAGVVSEDPTGPNKPRQERPHCHCARVTPDGKYVCIVDLGTDRVKIYSAADGSFVRDLVTTPAGAGPRHIVFHPNGRFAFVIFELENYVTSYRYEDGRFTPLQQLKLTPDGFDGYSKASAIKLSADGKELYCSNRGHESIAVFSVDAATGALSRRGVVKLEGAFPWDFEVLPGGIFAVGFEKDGVVRTYRYNAAACTLSPIAEVKDMGSIFCTCFLPASAPAVGELRVGSCGRLDIPSARACFTPKAHMLGWKATHSALGGYDVEKDGSRKYRIFLDDGRKDRISGDIRATPRADGAADVVCTFTPAKDTHIEQLCLSASLKTADYAGGRLSADGKDIAFPADFGKMQLLTRRVGKLSFFAPGGDEKFSISFPEPTSVALQDDRLWNSHSFTLRLFPAGKVGGVYKGGETRRLAFTVSVPGGLVVENSGPVTIAAGSEWVPLVSEPDVVPGSAVDFSAIGTRDAPTGKHGWVVARGGHFEFEGKPGIPQRFYGVNVCFSAAYVERPEARRFVQRLVSMGYNALRIHHYETQLTKGTPGATGLDPKMMDRLDGLMAECAEAGIYVTTDLFVSRTVPWRAIGEDRDGNVPMQEFKELVPVHPGAYSNFVAFSRALLDHVNPYTGRRWADEPALAFLALINEGNLANSGCGVFERTPQWQSAWKKWLAAKKASDPSYASVPDTFPKNIWSRDRHAAALSLFLAEVEENFVSRMKTFLRDEMKCRALITDMSCWHNPACYQVPRAKLFDYVDDHFYVDHPRFLERRWTLPSSCPNTNPMRGAQMGAQGVAFRRLFDKPFTITEYNYSGPGRFRGVGGIATGTAAALQDWDGVWRFTWSHSDASITSPEKAKMGYFDMAGDPLSLAAERASICLFLRGDIAPLPESFAVVIPEERLSDISFSPMNDPGFAWGTWYAKLGTLVSGSIPAGSRGAFYPEIYKERGDGFRAAMWPSLAKDAPLPPQAGGAVSIDGEKGTFTLSTPRTAGGFAEGGRIVAGALEAELSGAATLWASSLDSRPISETGRMLVTHLTDVQNTGIKYADRELTILLDWGRLPHLMRVGSAKVSIAVKPGGWKVYALSPGGRRLREVQSSVEGGRLSFTASVAADPSAATYLYELVEER
jgi:6-phosphogluconolactonase (cycloisomerase 2 family)